MQCKHKKLLLGAGLQSCGSTLVSWCFLQRADVDGVLDAENDLLPGIDPCLGRPLAWYKTTIGCFRLRELAEQYCDDGWQVRPLLIIRDVRKVWASLVRKPYGRNGMTAEDPPLRVRLRRFKDDWEWCRRASVPILRYESLLAQAEATLRSACADLELPWDPGMLNWPKNVRQIADARCGNESFWITRDGGLLETLGRYADRSAVPQIASGDLRWLEREFREFNQANGYPARIDSAEPSPPESSADAPSFAVTRRYEWETRQRPIRWILTRVGIPYRKLIERRERRKAA